MTARLIALLLLLAGNIPYSISQDNEYRLFELSEIGIALPPSFSYQAKFKGFVSQRYTASVVEKLFEDVPYSAIQGNFDRNYFAKQGLAVTKDEEIMYQKVKGKWLEMNFVVKEVPHTRIIVLLPSKDDSSVMLMANFPSKYDHQLYDQMVKAMREIRPEVK